MFVYEREISGAVVIYDLKRGHEAGLVATVHDPDFLDAMLAALNRKPAADALRPRPQLR